jgi:predicted N-acyltransferase
VADIEIGNGISELPRDEWNALVGDDSPFLEWEWLASLEESGAVGGRTGWDPRPLVAREQGRLVAACPLYLKGHSEGEFVFDWGWADAAHRAGIDYYPKLLAGVPFTPVSGSRFLVAPGQDADLWSERLAASLRELCIGNELSGVHVNFCQRAEAETMAEQGYLQRLGIQYHWSNAGYESFEDYLSRFRSKRRNQIRREMREMEKQQVRIETLVGDDIPDELFDPMYQFYLSTIQNRFYGRQYLNRELFGLVAERFRHRLVFVVAFQGDEAIAGTFNVAKGDAMYGRYWGATRPLRHLHFNVCYYAAVAHCIEAGIQRFEPGAGGDYKQLRGFDAQPTWSGHFLADPRLSEAVGRFLDSEREQAEETIGWLREQSALK